jgi:hypothetical protein
MTQAKTEDAPARRKSSKRESTEAAPPVVVDAAPAVAGPIVHEAVVDEAVVDEAVVAEAAPAEPVGRDRIQQQLEQLKQREAELRRELAMADHPELADAIRSIEGRAYGVSRVEAKMAEGLSKAEQRRKETLEKKLAGAVEKRAEIDAQIAALELELLPLGEARHSAFAKDRAEALAVLVALLRTHEAALAQASLDITTLVPALTSWQTEIAALRAEA